MVTKRETTEIRRKQIIDAARELIVKCGSEHVTVRKMAREIGVTEGAIYRHFKSKRDILSFLVDDIEETLLSEMELNPAGDSYGLDTLEKVITTHMSNVVRRRGVAFQVIAEIISLGDRRLNRKVYDVISKYVKKIEEALAKGAKAGTVKNDTDLNAAAVLFFGMTQGVVNMWALSGYSFDLEQEYSSLWKVFRKAISTR